MFGINHGLIVTALVIAAAALARWRTTTTRVPAFLGGSRPFALLLGDSLTGRGFQPEHHGWVASLSDRYSRKLDLVNRGYGGWNSRWVLRALPHLLPRWGPDAAQCRWVTLWLGANDAVDEWAKQHVPLVEFRANLRAIISQLRAAFPEAKLLLLTPPPCDTDAWAAHRLRQGKSSERSPQQVGLYAEAVREVAHEHAGGESAVLVDIHRAFGGADGKGVSSLTLEDGVHLGANGSDLVAGEVLRALDGLGLGVEACAEDAPGHAEIESAADIDRWYTRG